jgi:hypothetical protein
MLSLGIAERYFGCVIVKKVGYCGGIKVEFAGISSGATVAQNLSKANVSITTNVNHQGE